MKRDVLVIDSHAMVAEFLLSYLEQTFKRFAFTKAGSTREARGLIGSNSFEMIITEISGLDSTGISLIKDVKELSPKTRCIVLTAEANAFWVDKALRAGAYGYVTKKNPSTEVRKALDAVSQGRKYLSPDVSQSFAEYFSFSQNRILHGVLSPRELEVFLQIGLGKSLKTISFDLNLSSKTVSVHKFNISKKTGLNSSARIARYCVENGLIRSAA